MKDKALELLRTTEMTDTQIAERLGTTRQKITAIKRQHFQQGLGDKVEDVIERTGAKAVVKMFTKGKDCGCDERKKRLNIIGGLKLMRCLDESEYKYLIDLYSRWDGTHTPPIEDWHKAQRIRERVFSLRYTELNPTCAACVKQVMNQMRELKDKYQNEKL